MCGISGYIGYKKLNADNVNSTLSLMRRRGPDNSDFVNYSVGNINIYLLHTRLSIIDIDSRSNQPFNYNGLTLIFNGEIYNYIELRKKLLKRDVTFNTESDTEILIKAFDEFGNDFLDLCEGMWAFAIWDDNKKKLILSRDRFGEKPLYLYHTNDGIYFASEIKFIKELSGHSLTVNSKHLYRYLVNGYKSMYKTNETFYKEIVEFPSSTFMEIDLALGIKSYKYWEPEFSIDNSITLKDAVFGIKERLIDSVKLRLRSDVPLAFCMSGGIDSNSLISIAKKVLDYDVHGFTIISDDKRYDETDLVRYSRDELNIKHTEIPVSKNAFIDNLKILIDYHDAPVSTISYYSHWLLMKSISEQGYRVSISGTAADEIFTGYFDHYNLYLSEIQSNKNLYEKSLKDWTEHISTIVRNPFLQKPDLYINTPDERRHIYLNSDEFSEYLSVPFSETFTERKYTSSLLRNRMLNEMFEEVVPVILHEDDLNAMYYSIENRSPFLDRELFEYSYSLPSELLISNGYNKYLLRKAMEGIVPDRILKERRKIGFNASIHSFLDINDVEVIERLLDGSPVYDFIRKNRIEKLLKKESLQNSESKFLFNFINAKLFVE